MATYNDFIVTKEFLDQNPNAVFIFGDNRRRLGYGGAASLRDHPQTYGFITKKIQIIWMNLFSVQKVIILILQSSRLNYS